MSMARTHARGEIAYLAYHDPLTGLANRAALEDALAGAVVDARAAGTSVALAFADLNEFKRVNDSLGHDVGDELLCQVADRLRKARAAGRPGRAPGRRRVPGPDPRPAAGGRAAAEAVGQRIADAMHAPFALGAAELLVDAAIGISLFPDDAETPEALRKHADAAMYEAKAAGGGVNVYGDGTVDPLERLELAARLRRGIERGELELHHQPILRLDRAQRDRRRVARALARSDARRPGPAGRVHPGGRAHRRDRRARRLGAAATSAAQARTWAEAGLYPNVGFNVSPRQLRRADVAAPLRRGRQRARHRARAASCSRSPSRRGRSRPRGSCPVLGELRAAGFALAIDDFGAGYSSLWRLRELPVQIIKVDRAFLPGVPHDPQATAVYSAILRLADACGCDVVAEGVEEAEHAEFLIANGCRIAQGYHFSRPVPAAECTALLEASIDPERRR